MLYSGITERKSMRVLRSVVAPSVFILLSAFKVENLRFSSVLIKVFYLILPLYRFNSEYYVVKLFLKLHADFTGSHSVFGVMYIGFKSDIAGLAASGGRYLDA